MVSSHLLTLLPLFVLLTLSLVFNKCGLLHIMTLGYVVILSFVAASGGWEVLMFAPLAGTGMISLILFLFCMARGDWV